MSKIPFADRHIEAKLSSIGAKVITATENTLTAKRLCEESSQLLQDAQIEIADLYESLGDVLANTNRESGQDEAAEANQSEPLAD